MVFHNPQQDAESFVYGFGERACYLVTFHMFLVECIANSMLSVVATRIYSLELIHLYIIVLLIVHTIRTKDYVHNFGAYLLPKSFLAIFVYFIMNSVLALVYLSLLYSYCSFSPCFNFPYSLATSL